MRSLGAAPPKRLEVQSACALADKLAVHCDVGCKLNNKGHQESWIGYKLHLDKMTATFP
jgi:hypothetical protein